MCVLQQIPLIKVYQAQTMSEENKPPETIIYVDNPRVWCMGEQMDHPKVYYTVPEGGEVVCGYCDIKFRMKEENE